MNTQITDFLLLVTSSHKSRVGVREAIRQWACPGFISVVCVSGRAHSNKQNHEITKAILDPTWRRFTSSTESGYKVPRFYHLSTGRAGFWALAELPCRKQHHTYVQGPYSSRKRYGYEHKLLVCKTPLHSSCGAIGKEIKVREPMLLGL